MYQWILPSLSEILAQNQPNMAECSPTKAEQQWRMSLAATQQLLINTLADATPHTTQGLVLAAPAPLFTQPTLTQNLPTVTFTAKPFNPLALMPFYLPTIIPGTNTQTVPQESILPLLPADPLATERFCLVFTDKFRLVLVLKEQENGDKAFSFSFQPEVVQQAWRSLGARVMLTNPEFFRELDTLVQKYSPVAPDYQIIIHFSQLLLQELTDPETNKEPSENPPYSTHKTEPTTPSPTPDIELLQAFAHEVRTPLTTIRTLTRLLLKQRDLPPNVTSRLEIIDHECTDQIDRMELLFTAAELENSPPVKSPSTELTPTCLDQVLRQSVPRWQQAAHRRNLTLDVVLPQQLPTVVSNPNILDQVLTGLMENFTRSLPPGGHIQVQVIPAGDQLKLQLSPQFHCQGTNPATETVTPPIRKALGQLLMFQPETGTISLNIAATKHLFQAIGGKLIVRQRQHYGEVLTIFLPLDVRNKQKLKL
ncbi:sensor histidine kinase [Umezakia ovalisporum]|uniref:histidine kinase n=1 Tax=Umezakia ovalisporum FSS-43 TaxID=2740520 RepID=A0ABT6K0Q6_9CYAN|nr:HAMP domain-containing sensor histidine kinase [Umezakia ovalisporum]MDH6055937.1 HAMP domain-containing histidine kinase [Umezakia ovalisporum FSS-43]MDH6066169.1 HAMP domain-containing histidine kinase [Umezakia ovalisporum APH033B]MDH6072569.1 HAMP domain-containing histidine kinase [Umezakia ovalisporum CobakiLakeA]MDH6074079.1 HAMP domain-containing histidine kinase [Umezakia ovalisporum CS-1034]MDH6081359.1 HAMP domain-containing histidine kinase [Umezakia ovalisporum FSS-44]